jgi:hypothetical protein
MRDSDIRQQRSSKGREEIQERYGRGIGNVRKRRSEGKHRGEVGVVVLMGYVPS